MRFEIARALHRGPALERSLWLLFTDGEEMGLLGAQALAKERELLRKIGLIVNVEARGVRVAGIGGGPGTGTGSGRTHGPIVPCSRGPAQSWEPEDMLDVRVMVVPPGPGWRPPGRPETRM